jgi:hypothetical protein
LGCWDVLRCGGAGWVVLMWLLVVLWNESW